MNFLYKKFVSFEGVSCVWVPDYTAFLVDCVFPVHTDPYSHNPQGPLRSHLSTYFTKIDIGSKLKDFVSSLSR